MLRRLKLEMAEGSEHCQSNSNPVFEHQVLHKIITQGPRVVKQKERGPTFREVELDSGRQWTNQRIVSDAADAVYNSANQVRNILWEFGILSYIALPIDDQTQCPAESYQIRCIDSGPSQSIPAYTEREKVPVCQSQLDWTRDVSYTIKNISNQATSSTEFVLSLGVGGCTACSYW